MEFAEWICRNKEQPCHVVYTDFRPTPLQHYLFPHGGEGIHLVVDEKGNFREDNFQKALGALTDSQGPAPDDPRGRGGKKDAKKGKKGANNSRFRLRSCTKNAVQLLSIYSRCLSYLFGIVI